MLYREYVRIPEALPAGALVEFDRSIRVSEWQCDIGGERAIKEEHRNWLNLDLRINTPTGSFTVGIDLCPRHAMEFLNPAEGAFQLHGLSVTQFLIDPTMKWEQLPLPEKGR